MHSLAFFEPKSLLCLGFTLLVIGKLLMFTWVLWNRESNQHQKGVEHPKGWGE